MLVCRNSLPPSKGHVSASNWLKLSHTQNSRFKRNGVWETCFQLSSSHTRAGPERRGEWILSDSPLYASLCACICAHACLSTVYLFAYVCLSVTCVHVCTCLCACVHTCDGAHTAGEATDPQDQKKEALSKKPSQVFLL